MEPRHDYSSWSERRQTEPSTAKMSTYRNTDNSKRRKPETSKTETTPIA